ncbi:GntR family transcriptional regulator, partial [Streptomyces klenkii]
MAARYHRIADDLRRQIRDGTLSPGDRLPTEGPLAARYNVSVPTLRSALRLLQQEGLTETIHGSGTYVRPRREPVRYANDRHRNSRRQTPETRTDLEYREIKAEEEASALMGVPVGTPLMECVYRSGESSGLPHTVVTAYVRRDSVPDLPMLLADTPSPWGDDLRAALASAGTQVVRTVEHPVPRTDERPDVLVAQRKQP